MASTPTVRDKSSTRKLKDLAEELSGEIGRKAARLSAEQRRERHKKLLEIAHERSC